MKGAQNTVNTVGPQAMPKCKPEAVYGIIPPMSQRLDRLARVFNWTIIIEFVLLALVLIWKFVIYR